MIYKSFFGDENWQLFLIIFFLKLIKSPEKDGISSKVLKALSDVVSVPLTHLINTNIRTGICPMHFKTAIVKPIYKGGDDEKCY